MELLLTDVTAMKDGYICVAGIDQTGRHYRPMLTRFRGGEWLRSFWHDDNGIIQVRNVVEFGALDPSPQPPHIEDHLVAHSGDVALVAALTRTEHWERLQSALDDDALSALGGGNQTIDAYGRVTVPEGEGRASLACARASELAIYTKDRAHFGADPQLRTRLRLPGTTATLDLPINDVRLFHANGSIDDRMVARAKEYAESRPLLVSVGLTRSRPGDDNPRHWLQVNAIHFR